MTPLRKTTYLHRYKRPRRLTSYWNRRRPPGSRALYVSCGRSKNRRHSRRNRHSNRHWAHRVPHSSIRQGRRRMSMMNRSRWSSSSLRMRRARGTVRRRRSILARHVRSGRPATPWSGFSMGFRRRLRHLWLFRSSTCRASIT